jgi:hypothetical protein
MSSPRHFLSRDVPPTYLSLILRRICQKKIQPADRVNLSTPISLPRTKRYSTVNNRTTFGRFNLSSTIERADTFFVIRRFNWTHVAE